MEWATKRQLEYLGILFLAVVLLVVVPFFIFIYKAPTCFDGAQNGGEAGIDCGGACHLLCSAQIAQPISRWDPRIFKTASSTYSVLAYLENPNVAGEVLNAPYSFKLYDASGVFITERTGSTYIPKGGNFAVFEPNIDVGGRTPTRATFSFDPNLTWVRNTTPPPKVDITNQVLHTDTPTPRVTATVTNNSLDRVANIDLSVIVSDGAGNAIGASRTYIDSLNAGESHDITFTWPTAFALTASVCSNPVDLELALDRSGSMHDLGDNPPEPLTDVKNAADFFVSQLDKNDQAGLVSFATEAATTSETFLTSDFATLRSAIDAVSILTNTSSDQTNISSALNQSFLELTSSRHRSGAQSVIVLLTDGVANAPTQKNDSSYPETAASLAAFSARNSGIRIFTIGLGKEVNASFLQNIASSPDDFYPAPTAQELTHIYAEIATKICTQKPASIEIIPRIFPYSIAF